MEDNIKIKVIEWQAWTKLIWFRTRTSGRLLWTQSI